MLFSTKALSLAALLITLPTSVLGQSESDVPAPEDYMMPSETPDAPKPKIHLGCYSETARGNSLKTYTNLNNAQMSSDRCKTHCSQFNSTMFGVSRGTWCFCGDILGTGTKAAPLSQCNTACPGNKEEFCGATNRVNIYGPEELIERPAVPSTNNHQGCFSHPAGGKALNDYPSLRSTKMTISLCQDHCSSYQAHYFGVQNGRDCLCGKDSKGAVVKPLSSCKTSCNGGDGNFCGSTTQFNLYELDFSRYKNIGQWGDLIKFPVIPVAIALLPESGNLLAW